MKKNFLTLVCSLLFSLPIIAQDKNDNKAKLGIGGVIGLPVGTHHHVEGIAYEANLLAEFPETKVLNMTLSAGYMSFTGKNGFTIDGGLVPLLAGTKFKLTPAAYFHLQIGAALPTGKGSDKSAGFAYSPSVGYVLSKHVDFSVRYFAAIRKSITESYFGLRLGFTF